MKIIALIAAILLTLTSVGCTARTVYESIRVQQEMKCQKLPGADRDECARRSGMNYDEYQRQLNEERKDK